VEKLFHLFTVDLIIVRYADDIIIGFEHETDARRFWDAMRERLGEYSCALCRQTPKVEASALIRHARICAGGVQKCGSLVRCRLLSE
jgi:hypothetical protein